MFIQHNKPIKGTVIADCTTTNWKINSFFNITVVCISLRPCTLGMLYSSQLIIHTQSLLAGMVIDIVNKSYTSHFTLNYKYSAGNYR